MGVAPALLRMRPRWPVSTSFVRRALIGRSALAGIVMTSFPDTRGPQYTI